MYGTFAMDMDGKGYGADEVKNECHVQIIFMGFSSLDAISPITGIAKSPFFPKHGSL